MSCLTLPLQGLACLGASRRALASRPEHLFQRAYTLQHLARRERAAARARGATRNQKDTRTQEKKTTRRMDTKSFKRGAVCEENRTTKSRYKGERAGGGGVWVERWWGLGWNGGGVWDGAVVRFGMERRWGWEGYSGGGVVKEYNGSAAEGNNIMVTRPAFTCRVLS